MWRLRQRMPGRRDLNPISTRSGDTLMNICGCLIHVTPEQSEAASCAISVFDGVEIHAADEDGRFVVVVEDTEKRRASEIIMDLHQVPGVVSLTLTYHHFEEPRHPMRPPEKPQTHAGVSHDHI